MNKMIEDLIIRFPNHNKDIVEYNTDNIDKSKLSYYYEDIIKEFNALNYGELDEFNIKNNDVWINDIESQDIPWKTDIKENIYDILNNKEQANMLKTYLIVIFKYENKRFYFFLKNKNFLLIKETRPFFIFKNTTVDFIPNAHDLKIFPLEWDFCIVRNNETSLTECFCKKNYMKTLFSEKSGEDLHNLFIKKMNDLFRDNLNHDSNHERIIIPPIMHFTNDS